MFEIRLTLKKLWFTEGNLISNQKLKVPEGNRGGYRRRPHFWGKRRNHVSSLEIVDDFCLMRGIKATGERN